MSNTTNTDIIEVLAELRTDVAYIKKKIASLDNFEKRYIKEYAEVKAKLEQECYKVDGVIERVDNVSDEVDELKSKMPAINVASKVFYFIAGVVGYIIVARVVDIILNLMQNNGI